MCEYQAKIVNRQGSLNTSGEPIFNISGPVVIEQFYGIAESDVTYTHQWTVQLRDGSGTVSGTLLPAEAYNGYDQNVYLPGGTEFLFASAGPDLPLFAKEGSVYLAASGSGGGSGVVSWHLVYRPLALDATVTAGA